MLHFHKVHKFFFCNNEALYQQILKTSLKYNIKINIWYYPKSSSEINGNGWVERRIYLLYLSSMRRFHIIKRNLARAFSGTFLVLVCNFMKTGILLRKWKGNALLWRKMVVLGKVQPISLLKLPLPLPWVLPTLRYSWYSHHIGSPVSNQGRFCWLTNTASAQLHFHPTYPGGGWWVPATRHPCYRAATCAREARRKAEAPLRDGFHHRQSFTQPRLLLTHGVECEAVWHAYRWRICSLCSSVWDFP